VEVLPRVGGEAPLALAVGADDVDVGVVEPPAGEGDPGAVGRPDGRVVLALRRRQELLAGAVAGHDVDARGTEAAAGEGHEPRPVRRARRAGTLGGGRRAGGAGAAPAGRRHQAGPGPADSGGWGLVDTFSTFSNNMINKVGVCGSVPTSHHPSHSGASPASPYAHTSRGRRPPPRRAGNPRTIGGSVIRFGRGRALAAVVIAGAASLLEEFQVAPTGSAWPVS